MYILPLHKRTIAFFISMLFILSSIIPLLSMSGETTQEVNTIDQGDGFYFTNSFTDVDLTDCEIAEGTPKIVLNPKGSNSFTYNFSTWTIESPNTAYTYKTLYFLRTSPPSSHIKYENKLENELDYMAIGTQNEETYPEFGSAEKTRIKQIHHFRFKITQDINTTNELGIYWYGKAINDVNTTLYYWQPSQVGELGIWKPADTKQSNGSYIHLKQNFTGDLFISQEGFVDICVVTTPLFSKQCQLYTDYVQVTAKGIGYATEGSARSPFISPIEIFHWENLICNNNIKPQTTLRYHLFYENETGNAQYVPEQYLPGNKEGFTNTPIDISDIPNTYNLSIHANLTTEDLSTSPEILSWALTWQPYNGIWQDSFNSSLRIQTDKTNNIQYNTGDVSLIHSLHNWPMFGQNPYNTRTVGGIGPDTEPSTTTWYASNDLGDINKNPILANGILYIPTETGEKIYAYDAQSTQGSTPVSPKYSCPLSDLSIDTTPLLTNKYIIAPTGATSKGGTIENVIYAFDKTLNDNPQWIFEYSSVESNNPYICYSSPPVFSNQNIYLTSWSGDEDIWESVWTFFNFSRGNNKLIVLDEQGNFQWQYTLPAGSFSSPAVLNNDVFVCCENRIGDSVIKISQNQVKEWGADIGPVGHANPIISNGTLFVVSKKTSSPFMAFTQLHALYASNGSIRWNQTLGNVLPYRQAGYATPTIGGETIFAASPDGMLYAFDVNDGSQVWNRSIYSRSIIQPYLTASPAYVDGIVYIGTPDGMFYALNADNGSIIWEKDMGNRVITTSPIIVDGLVYFACDNGNIYCYGNYELPSESQITGSMVSIPINRPDEDKYYWGNFFANYTTDDGNIRFNILDENYNILLNNITSGNSINSSVTAARDTIRLYAEFTMNPQGMARLNNWSISYNADEPKNVTIFYDDSFTSSNTTPPVCTIDVINEYVGLWNTSAQYQFTFENNSGNYTSDWIPANCTGENGSKVKEQITANLSYYNVTSDNESANTTVYLQIHFRINDTDGNITQSNWFNFSEPPPEPDTTPPFFYNTSFIPNSKWIASPTPVCSIEAIDLGTDGNISGLDISSAQFNITYNVENETGNKTQTFKAQCTGSNGTKTKQKITANIANIPGNDTITNVHSIFFIIKDMAGNVNSSSTYDLRLDDIKPTSTIINTAQIPEKTNKSPVDIIAEAEDQISGVAQVELYYRMVDSTNWKQFNDALLDEPYEWGFMLSDNEDGGLYELCTIATDNAGNVESEPSTGEVEFIIDTHIPYVPDAESEYRFTKNEVPTFTDITFEDDYLLHSVYYRMNFEETNKWTPITTLDPDQKSIQPIWNMTLSQWEVMTEDVSYQMFFKLEDSLGNVLLTTTPVYIIKDLSNDTIYDPDLSDFDTLNWDNKYLVTVSADEQNISRIQLWYQYSDDNASWSNWTQYGENLTTEPFEWVFSLDDGAGYYRFQSRVFDLQGQVTISAEKMVYITLFPMIELLVFTLLVVGLIIISLLLFRKRTRA